MIEDEKDVEPESNGQNQNTIIEPNRLLIEILILAIICAVLSGSIYYYRTNFLELTSLENNIFRAVRMTLVYLLIPIIWLVKIRGFEFQDLGFSTNKLFLSIILGLVVYGIALAVFLISLGNPEFDRYFKWGSDLPAAEFAATMALIAWMAALTDIWTRGMIMMPVLKYHGILLAVFLQNLVWFAAHVYEIDFLRGSLSLAGAVALTLALGILGDIAAIKTKNIIGLSIGHIFLNLAFFGYVRIIF